MVNETSDSNISLSHHLHTHELSFGNALLFGSLATAIISILSLAGGCMAPILKADTKHRWMHFFVSMAVATLSSDAILHIIPQMLGSHSHSHSHGHAEGHEEENENPEWNKVTSQRKSLLRLSIIVLSIYILYFIEFFIFYRKKSIAKETNRIIGIEKTVSNHAWKCKSSDAVADGSNENLMGSSATGEELETLNASFADESFKVDEKAKFCGLQTRAVIILVGDAIHNLVDGIAIGASFLISVKLGIITSIAVVCHELPHEIGDMAVLLESGLSLAKALVLNLLSALTAFIGLFISLAMGKNEEFENVLLGITAGMFLYVAWIDMLSHLKHDATHKDHWVLACLMQFIGFTFGFSLIFALGWFEHLLHTG